jgi:trehalose-phosphatase
MTVPSTPFTPEILQRLSGSPFVALLDIDGTLSPIARRHDEAFIPEETRRVVAELAAQPDAIVVAVSGRAAHDAARMLDVPNSWTIGNHGLEIAAPNEPPRPRQGLEQFAEAMSEALEQTRAFAETHPGVVVEDKRWTLSVHYRLADASTIAEVVSQSRRIAERLGLRPTPGRRVVEIRPPVDIDKGTASCDLLRHVGAITDDASIFCAGDDRTDEDMFRCVRAAFPRAVTVRVLNDDDPLDARADYASSAEFSVPDPDALRAMLLAIVERRRKR